MNKKVNKLLILLMCVISLACESEYSKYKIQNEPVFDDKYYKASLSAIDDYINRNPGNAEGYYKKAVVLAKINKKKEAEKSVEKALELEMSADFLLMATQLYLENGNKEKSLKTALEAEKEGINNGWLFTVIANLTLQKGDSLRAFEYMDKAIASDPNNPVNLVNRGNLLLTIKDTIKALESFNIGLQLDSANADVLTILTDINLAQRQYKKAEVLLNKKLQNHQPDHKMRVQSAFLLWKTGNLDSALQVFKTIIEKEPSDFSSYNYISLIEYQKKHYDSAVWYAEKTLSLKSDEKAAMLTLARVKDINRQYYNALVQYDKLIKIDTTFSIAKEERARIQKKINNLARENKVERAPAIPQIQQRF